MRPRRPADDAAIAALSREAFARFSRRPDRAVRGMVSETTTRTLVAAHDDEVVGMAVVDYRVATSTEPWHEPMVAHLDAIAVAPRWRGLGVGKALLAYAEREASARGAVCMSLMTAVTNHRARDVFHAAGYLTLGSAAAVYRRSIAGVMMLKPLGEPPSTKTAH